MIRHIVLLRVREDVTEAEKRAVYDRLDALRDIVPGLVEARFATNASPEGVSQGFDDGFVMDFVDAAARDAYLAQPDHVAAGAALVALLEGGLDGLIVFDAEI